VGRVRNRLPATSSGEPPASCAPANGAELSAVRSHHQVSGRRGGPRAGIGRLIACRPAMSVWRFVAKRLSRSSVQTQSPRGTASSRADRRRRPPWQGRAGRCYAGRAVERSSARLRRPRDSVLLSDCPRPRWRALAFTGGMNMSRSIPLLPRGPDHPPRAIPVCLASSAARSVGTAW